MKGTPDAIMCGNSERALGALRRAGAPITAVDVLLDMQIREDLSAISGWPTIPDERRVPGRPAREQEDPVEVATRSGARSGSG